LEGIPCPDPIVRPDVVDLTVCYQTREEFSIVFGTDAVLLMHPVEIWSFVSDPEWQAALLEACVAYAVLFKATEGVVTGEESPIVKAFFGGISYEGALQEAAKGGHREVGTIAELTEVVTELDEGTYREDFYLRGYWRFFPKRRGQWARKGGQAR